MMCLGARFFILIHILGLACSNNDEVLLYQTAQDSSDFLTLKEPLPLLLDQDNNRNSGSFDYQITIDASIKYQNIEGFGGAFTDSTAFNFMQLSQERKNELLEAYFGASGHQYNLCRLTIGSSDFSLSHYNYDNTTDDYNLLDFNIDHDKEYIIPMIKEAQKIAASNNKELDFIASPWSPPAWMKRNLRMSNSLMPGLIQEDKIFKSWALYMSKYLSAYKNEGIDISHITIQNEPHVAKQFIVTYEACGYEPEHERDFVRDYLGPQLSIDHPNVKIWIHDDQKDSRMIDMVDTVMNDSEASKYVHGVAFHWYDEWGLNYDYLDQVNQKYPNLKLLATEATNPRPLSENIRSDIWTYGQKYATDILRDMNHMTCGWIDWNMLLDIRGGPSSQHIGQNTKLNDLGNCDSPIRLNGTIYPVIDDDKYQNGDMNLFYQPSYWFYGHFARFISRGSFKISSSQEPPPSSPQAHTGLSTSLESIAFMNNKDIVVIVTNFVDEKKKYSIDIVNVGSVIIEIPAQAAQTLIIPIADNSE